MLDIKFRWKGETVKIDEFWLRDHCQCPVCYDPVTKQRIYNFLAEPADIHPMEMLYVKYDLLKIKWNTGHKSTYSLKFIYEAQLQRLIVRRLKTKLHTLWNQDSIMLCVPKLHVNLADLVSRDETVKYFISTLVRYGIGFINNVPANSEMTEMAIRRLFPIMNTFFGDMFSFSEHNKDHADTAYTNQYIAPHTDNTYFCDAAGLQVLHCTLHKNGSGGENFFVDGFSVAEELKQRNPEAFEVLSTVNVPAEFVDKDINHTHSAPIIRLDPVTGEVIQIRYNMYDRAAFNSIRQEDMKIFYDSLRELTKLVEDINNQWEVKLYPGTVVVFDNWRTLHARRSYTGHRRMVGCYVARTDFMSKARTLNIIE